MVSENPTISELFAVALEVQEFLRELAQPFAFIGGLALQCWGEPRVTRDVDLTILTRFEGEPEILNTLRGFYQLKQKL
jgi:hypothetical protein